MKPIYLACVAPSIEGWRADSASIIDVERQISQSACVVMDSSITPRELYFALATGTPILRADSPDLMQRIAAGEDDTESIPVTNDPYQPYLYWLYQRIAAHLFVSIHTEIPDTDAITWDDLWGRVILTGVAGSGKTIAMLRFARDVIVTRLQDTSHPLPILAPIATWDPDKRPSLAEWLSHTSPYLTEVQQAIQKGEALLLFDALEKLGSEREDRRFKTTYDPRQRFVEMLQSQAKRCRALISCREADYNTLEKLITVEGVVKIPLLDESQIVPSVAEWARNTRLPQMVDLYMATKAESYQAALAHFIEQCVPQGDELRHILGYVAMQNISSHLQHDNIITYGTFSAVMSGDEQIHRMIEKAVTQGALMEGLQQQTFRFVTRAMRDYLAVEAAFVALEDDDAGIRRIAAGVMGKLKHRAGVPNLIERLRDENFLVRRTAAEALGIIGDPQAVEALIRLLHVDEWLVRRYAAWSLGQIRDTRAVPALMVALEDPSAEVRFRSAEALGMIRSPEATRALTKTLSDQNEIVKRFATWALKQIGTPEAMIALSRWNV